MKKIMSLVVIQQGQKVLLGFKKRGFGEGRWNGFGGKLEGDETVEETAIRETKEEIGVDLLDLEKMAIMEFSWQDNDDTCEVHLFKSTKLSNEPMESDEMKPSWFDINNIPLNKMWPDDKYWYKYFLDNKKFIASFLFDKSLGDNIVEYKIKKVEAL